MRNSAVIILSIYIYSTDDIEIKFDAKFDKQNSIYLK